MAKKIKNSYVKQNCNTRDRLIQEHLSLVKYVVSKIMIHLPPFVEQEDLIEYGIIGLIEAVDRYDKNRDVKFSTFAISRIRGSVLDYLRSQDWLPRSARDRVTMARNAYNSLEQKLNRPPMAEEIAAALKIRPEEWDKLMAEINFTTFISLEEMKRRVENNVRNSESQQIKDYELRDPLSNITTQEEKERLIETITSLPKRERMVITLYYYEELMIKEISQLLSISESRVSQLHHQALFLLRMRLQKSSHD
ncbi:MAG: FliA/WhiG family RNA polymerase sigma factor [Candidatus Brocadiaceae bacterium]|nr:FliA/WhiG family RNA polymerase sigma factor [Candidatus Brocadiaceae bacterium]